jgi:murein DD-endopeptidase MepM/ murein hydrolase activator NlpD
MLAGCQTSSAPPVYVGGPAEPHLWPVAHGEGRVISPYGMRNGRLHKGIDIKAEKGAQVVAAADGRVAFAGTMRGYGRVVFVRHAGGYETVYAHLKRILVDEGDVLRAGQVLGRMGDSGRATTPHVHYEVRKDDKLLDPANYLPRRRQHPAG